MAKEQWQAVTGKSPTKKQLFLSKILLIVLISILMNACMNQNPFVIEQQQTQVSKSNSFEACKPTHGYLCEALVVVQNLNTTFCSAAKVGSTSIRSYFMNAAGGSVAAPIGSKYPVHQANWTLLRHLSTEMQNKLVVTMDDRNGSSREQQWTQVFFVRNVVDRFVSGYLDKIVNDCSRQDVDDSVLYRTHYVPLGFSCERHTDLEEFINFIQHHLDVDGHFAPQTLCCRPQLHPYSDVIVVDEDLNWKLKQLSTKLGIHHHIEPSNNTRAHKTGAKSKAFDLFKGRRDLLERVLDMYKDDCLYMPSMCNVTELMSQI